jgi:hypothetical protein
MPLPKLRVEHLLKQAQEQAEKQDRSTEENERRMVGSISLRHAVAVHFGITEQCHQRSYQPKISMTQQKF